MRHYADHQLHTGRRTLIDDASLSIVVPVLDEAGTLPGQLSALAPLRAAGAEIVVVDGGSRDGTIEAANGADRIVGSGRGRARQMNAGAAAAHGDLLLFLHADTRLPADAWAVVRGALERGARWGFFGLAIAGRHPLLPVVAALATIRSRLTGIATGDQALFVTRELFECAGGFPDVPLMEDLALCARLRPIAPPARLKPHVTTSGRRWERGGVLRTVLLMWRLRLLYRLGVPPERLVTHYADVREPR